MGVEVNAEADRLLFAGLTFVLIRSAWDPHNLLEIVSLIQRHGGSTTHTSILKCEGLMDRYVLVIPDDPPDRLREGALLAYGIGRNYKRCCSIPTRVSQHWINKCIDSGMRVPEDDPYECNTMRRKEELRRRINPRTIPGVAGLRYFLSLTDRGASAHLRELCEVPNPQGVYSVVDKLVPARNMPHKSQRFCRTWIAVLAKCSLAWEAVLEQTGGLGPEGEALTMRATQWRDERKEHPESIIKIQRIQSQQSKQSVTVPIGGNLIDVQPNIETPKTARDPSSAPAPALSTATPTRPTRSIRIVGKYARKRRIRVHVPVYSSDSVPRPPRPYIHSPLRREIDPADSDTDGASSKGLKTSSLDTSGESENEIDRVVDQCAE